MRVRIKYRLNEVLRNKSSYGYIISQDDDSLTLLGSAGLSFYGNKIDNISKSQIIKVKEWKGINVGKTVLAFLAVALPIIFALVVI